MLVGFSVVDFSFSSLTTFSCRSSVKQVTGQNWFPLEEIQKKREEISLLIEILSQQNHLFKSDQVEIGYRTTEEGPGSGMINIGNTCYLNSTLQVNEYLISN